MKIENGGLILVNKKIILSVLVIGCIATVAGAGTWAYFDDAKTSNNNVIGTGTLSLTANGNALDSFTLKDLVPGKSDDKAKTISLKNGGTIKGQLTAEISATGDVPPHLSVTLDGKPMTNGAKIDLGQLSSNEQKDFNIGYNFQDTGQSQNDEQSKTITYVITYRLKQIT